MHSTRYENARHDLKRTSGLWATVTLAALAVMGWVRAPGQGHAPGPPPRRMQMGKGEAYPYQSGAFTRFVSDSYHEADGGQAADFYAWMDKTCLQSRLCAPGDVSLLAAVGAKRVVLDSTVNPKQRAQAEMAFAATLHHWIKSSMPVFSLQEGFEFANVAKHRERQCLLQSVLLASLLQEADIDAGVVMVNKNADGRTSNNGHCVTLLKLSDGMDVLVDASDRQPFVRHQGLFAKDSALKNYRYVEPVFQGDTPLIASYQSPDHAVEIAARPIRPLDTEFLRSQFDFYRGERTPNGLLDAHPTDDGLAKEVHYLRSSVHACPQNPLSVYMLGRVEWRRTHAAEARRQLSRAARLYQGAGWVPSGLRDARHDAHMASLAPVHDRA